MIGLVAHELAHAVRAAKLGENWLSKMGSEWTAANDRKYRLEERRADAIASAWGFPKEICAMRNERKNVLNPYLAVHGARILHQIHKRHQREEQQAQKRFELLDTISEEQ